MAIQDRKIIPLTAHVKELGSMVRVLESHKGLDQLPELCKIVSNLMLKVDRVQDALLAVTAKLDADDVTNLDTDYEAEAKSKL